LHLAASKQLQTAIATRDAPQMLRLMHLWRALIVRNRIIPKDCSYSSNSAIDFFELI
jgi:hypothetical protein